LPGYKLLGIYLPLPAIRGLEGYPLGDGRVCGFGTINGRS